MTNQALLGMSDEAGLLLIGLLPMVAMALALAVAAFRFSRPRRDITKVTVRVGPGKTLPAGTYKIDLIDMMMTFTPASAPVTDDRS